MDVMLNLDFESQEAVRLEERRRAMAMARTGGKTESMPGYARHYRFSDAYIQRLKDVVSDNRRKQQRGKYLHSRKGRVMRSHPVKLGLLPTHIGEVVKAFTVVVAQTIEQVNALIEREGYSPAKELVQYNLDVTNQRMSEQCVDGKDEEEIRTMRHYALASHYNEKPAVTLYVLTECTGSAREVIDSVQNKIRPTKMTFLTDYLWIHSDVGWVNARSRSGMTKPS